MRISYTTACLICIVSGAVGSCFGEDRNTKENTVVNIRDLTPERVIGPLGLPVGKGITVECVVDARHDKGVLPDWVTVTTVNGEKLKKPISIPISIVPGIEMVHPLKKGDVRRLRGYQTVWFYGIPRDMIEELGEMQGEEFGIISALIVYKDLTSK